MSERTPPPIPYEKAIGAFNDSERRVLSACDCIGWAEYPYVGQSVICGRHGMTEVTVINPDDGDSERREWVPLSERLPWHFSDRYVRPNAWPRFSIWPFRLRRGGQQ